MANRWYHRPVLHVPVHGVERKVGWLELFYDLVYVAAIIQLGDNLSHHVDFLGFLSFAALFVPLWHTWTGFTFYANRYVVDDIVHRLLVFGQMFAIGAMAMLVPQLMDGHHAPFVAAYAVARTFLVLMYARSWWQVAESREFSRFYTLGFSAGVGLWIVAALVPWTWFPVVAGLALAVDVLTPLNRHGRDLIDRFPPDVAHMTERYGLFTIIVLGESFVKVLSGVAEAGAPPMMMGMAGLAMVLTVGLWWIYFDDVAGSRLRRVRFGPMIWVYTHLPLTIGITAVGVSIKKAAFFDANEVATDKYRFLLCTSLALALGAAAVIDAVTERRQAELSDRLRVRVRAASALLVMLLAPAGAGLPGWVFVSLVALVMVAQVLFDLFSAPERLDETAHHDQEIVFKPRERPTNPTTGSTRQAAAGGSALRLGTPDELRRDLYAHLMEGSWGQLMLQVGLLYVLTNVVFGALFLLDPSGVHGMSARGFVDAFSFSVQTLTTIGYGAMYPESTYAQVLVTLEAALGLLGVALVTGICFAKVSRPRAGVLFSKVITFAPHHGQPTFALRVGNARGNDIVEATVRISVLVDDVSPEGHRMRKLIDLPLTRHRSPVFALSWTIFHTVDEHSPLYGMTQESIDEHIGLIIVTLTGHDLTYHQTIHARHMYYADDFRFDARFVDVLTFMDDGRPRVDYHLFHDTVPLDAVEEDAL